MKLNMGANDNREASKSMIKCLLQVALEQHNVNTNITPDQVYEMLDPEQLQVFTDSMEWQLIKSVDFRNSPRRSMGKKSSKLNIELGNYPLKPWINSKDNPGQ